MNYKNKDQIPAINIPIAVSCSLSKSTDIMTHCYDYINDGSKYNADDKELRYEYQEQEFTIPELLQELKAYLIKDLQSVHGWEPFEKKQYLNKMLKSLSGWNIDELNVIEE